MARNQPRPEATSELRLEPLDGRCRLCEGRLWVAYHNARTVTTLEGLVRLRLVVRRCVNRECELYQESHRPEQEGAFALPQGEFGLDVIALVGALRHAEHRSVPEIHRELSGRGVGISERSVTNLLDRYEELVALRLSEHAGLRERLEEQGRAILAIDGLQPDVGHEVLWVVRECLSGEVLLARSLLGGTQGELAPLLREVTDALPVPVAGVISDGQRAIRKAVQSALPGVPHQLCQFHYLREAAKEVYEADRHAKKELKKRVRGVRPIERALEGREDPEAEAVRGYCLAVRSAITDDGRPPLAASGLKLHERLSSIHDSVERVSKKGNFPEGSPGN
jgi:Transposase, Mutator family